MADIASIGFSAPTGPLANAKAAMEALVPAAGRAERAADRLNKMMEAGQRATTAAARADLMKANALLSAARASDNANRSEIAAAASAQRKAKATYDAARASQSQTRASIAAAAAAQKEAAALDAAAAAARKRNQVPPPSVNPANPNRPNPANNNDISAGAYKANVGNIAAQFQDIGVTAAMGMNPLLIALQQGTQLSMALGGGLKALVAALATVFSPVALLTIGLVALAAAIIQLINWTKIAQFGLNALASVLPELAIAAAVAGTALTIAFAPAIATTIWSIASAITIGLMNAILAIVATIGAIPIMIAGVIASFFIFRDEITKVLGVDVVGAAKIGANYIIGSFVAAYNDIEFLWKKFPDVIGAAAIGAANLAIGAVNSIVSTTLGAINGLIQAVNKIGSVGEYLGIGSFAIDEMDTSQFNFDSIANDAADRLGKAVGGRNKQLQEDLSRDYLGAIGGAITGAASTAADKLRKFSDGLDDEKTKKKKGGKTDTEKFSDIINGAERTIASLEAERASIGMSEIATARLKYETQLLNEAKQKNINLSDPQRAKLMELASSMASLEVETKKAKEAFDFAKDTTKSFFSDLRSGISEGKSLWESFGDAAMNVLDKVIDKLLNNLIDALFEVNAAGSKGGSGGGLGGLLGGALSWLFSAKGNAFDGGGVKAFAKGGSFTNSVVSSPTMFAYANGGAFGVMGEAGPEAVMPLARGPDGSLGVRVADSASSGAMSQTQSGGNIVYEDNSTWIIGEGADKATVQELKKAQAEDRKTFNLRVQQANDTNSRRNRGN